jgi:hypothetical protein
LTPPAAIDEKTVPKMKIAYYISVAATALSLVLAIILFAVGNSNQTLQTEIQKQQGELQKQQEQINTGNTISQQVGPNLLRDMAISSVKNEKMKALLSKHGYNVSMPPATPAPSGAGATPAPTAPATPAAPAPAGDAAPPLR